MMMAGLQLYLPSFEQAQHEDPQWYKAPQSAKGHEIKVSTLLFSDIKHLPSGKLT